MDIDENFALIYGIMLGDGCLSKYSGAKAVIITCDFHSDKKFFDEIVVPKLQKVRGKPVKYRLREDQGKIEINFLDKELFDKFSSLGFPIGKKGEQLKIPEKFEANFMKQIVAGIFATDGSLVKANNNGTIYPRLEINSISKNLLEQIMRFLTENNMKGNIYEIHRKEGFHIYRMEFPGKKNLVKFRDFIGFVNPKHEEKYKKWWAGGDLNSRPPHYQFRPDT